MIEQWTETQFLSCWNTCCRWVFWLSIYGSWTIPKCTDFKPNNHLAHRFALWIGEVEQFVSAPCGIRLGNSLWLGDPVSRGWLAIWCCHLGTQLGLSAEGLVPLSVTFAGAAWVPHSLDVSSSWTFYMGLAFLQYGVPAEQGVGCQDFWVSHSSHRISHPLNSIGQSNLQGCPRFIG